MRLPLQAVDPLSWVGDHSPPCLHAGTHYKPADKSITYVPLGEGCEDFAIVSLDTGTMRPGLEKVKWRITTSGIPGRTCSRWYHCLWGGMMVNTCACCRSFNSLSRCPYCAVHL